MYEAAEQNRVDIIKAYGGLSNQMIGALVQEGRKNSLSVFVEQHWKDGSIELVGVGVMGLAHLPDFPLNVVYRADTIRQPRALRSGILNGRVSRIGSRRKFLGESLLFSALTLISWIRLKWRWSGERHSKSPRLRPA